MMTMVSMGMPMNALGKRKGKYLVLMTILLVCSLVNGFQIPVSPINSHKKQSTSRNNADVLALSLTKQQLDNFRSKTESQAITASESWVVDATDFLTQEESSIVEESLGGRADVACHKVGKYHNSPPTRVRYAFANPDLGYDDATAEADYCSVLKVDGINLSSCDPWPNVVTSIGISLEHVGDIVVDKTESIVYLAVHPDSVKTCIRLLPKELPGTGVTVTPLEADEIAMLDVDGELQDMEIQRLDKRAQKN